MERFYSMAEEVGLPRRKHRNEQSGESGPARVSVRAEDPSHGIVTRDALDVARYLAGMAAQLEAMAIAAHLDQVALFLGMAKTESETLAERAEEES
jgi:hypothetical protein